MAACARSRDTHVSNVSPRPPVLVSLVAPARERAPMFIQIHNTPIHSRSYPASAPKADCPRSPYIVICMVGLETESTLRDCHFISSRQIGLEFGGWFLHVPKIIIL